MRETFSFITEVIDKFKAFGLVINIKKTMLLEKNNGLANKLKSTFQIANEDTHSRTEICLTNEGFLTADHRYYEPKVIYVKALSKFNTFGIRRLLFLTALDARY